MLQWSFGWTGDLEPTLPREGTNDRAVEAGGLRGTTWRLASPPRIWMARLLITSLTFMLL